jgi:selenocysteine-specific elongation factor
MTSGGPLTLGTAGHIDHGKTALVGALTGVDTDRLPEERARGISIALGYAPLTLPSGRALSLVDVPGHERFVRTMVAGASGIDLYLMVVAADDGVMPQTREHAAVLEALDVRDGVVAVTKADLADPARALAEAGELLPGAEAVACSAVTGAGVAEVAAALDRVVEGVPSRASAQDAPAVLHVDRSFTVKGIGTVVTGTLWSGALRAGEMLTLLPGDRSVRVRGLQVHDTPVQRADAGQRVAVSLAGVRARDVARGDVLSDGDAALAESTVLDCTLQVPGARHGERVQVHHGARDSPGRLSALGDDLWQVRLERPLLAAAGDRLVIRRLSPPDTLGGGTILDARAHRHGRRPDVLSRLHALRDGEGGPIDGPPSSADRPTPHRAARSGEGGPIEGPPPSADRPTPHRSASPHRAARSGEGGPIERPSPSADRPTPHRAARSGEGGPIERPPPSADRPTPRRAATPHRPAAPPLDPAVAARAEARLREAGVALVSEAQLGPDAAALPALRADGRAVRVSGTLYAHADAVAGVRARIVELIEAAGSTSLAEVRDALGTGRKPAQAFLEHLDAERVTRRRPDDRRVLRRSASTPPS